MYVCHKPISSHFTAIFVASLPFDLFSASLTIIWFCSSFLYVTCHFPSPSLPSIHLFLYTVHTLYFFLIFFRFYTRISCLSFTRIFLKIYFNISFYLPINQSIYLSSSIAFHHLCLPFPPLLLPLRRLPHLPRRHLPLPGLVLIRQALIGA